MTNLASCAPNSRSKTPPETANAELYFKKSRRVDGAKGRVGGMNTFLLLFNFIFGQWRRRFVELDHGVSAELLIEAKFDLVLGEIFGGARGQHYFQRNQELVVADLLEIVIEHFLRGSQWKRI